MRLWHDPGHGGSNPGLVYNGFIERDWVVDWSHFLINKLTDACSEQRMARYGNVSMGYSIRASDARAWDADAALLHHVNGMFFPKDHIRAGEARQEFHGTMAFVVFADKVARQWVTAILDGTPPVLQRTSNILIPSHPIGWTQDAYGHLHHYADRGIPAVLMEYGFATNPGDRKALNNPMVRWQIAKSIKNSLSTLKEILYV